MSDARLRAADHLRRLGHAIVDHQADDAFFDRATTAAGTLLADLEQAPSRQRAVLEMKADLFAAPAPEGGARSHFPDCIVTGHANPLGVAASVHREGEEGVLTATLGAAFEGAPGRAHGGIVAALLDEVMGFVLSIVGTPAYTGRLTVTYRAPTPLGVELEFRARLLERSGRKLTIAAEGRHGGKRFAEAEALFIAVDPDHFNTGGPGDG